MKHVRRFAALGGCMLAGALAVAGPASAHPGHALAGGWAGLAHPFQGLDHFLAMLAVGVWAAGRPIARAWQGPAVFLAALSVGGVAGVLGLTVPYLETGLVGSVALLGLMIATADRIPANVSLAAIAGFAVLHGMAHGVEAAAPFGAYMAGFVVASAALHTFGFLMGLVLTRTRYGFATAGLALVSAGAALFAA